ncbi:MAG: tail fiber domain-containing protein, partial [Bacteroidia bacterium]
YTGIGGDPALNKYYLNSINPTLTLEVNSPALADSALYSGMRFTDMTSKVAPFTNPGKGVLGLDSTGRVIYVEGGSGFGNLCANPSSPLPNNFEVPMGGFNYSFTGFGQANANAVHIGNTCGINFPAKLFVIQQPSSLLPFPAAIASATYSGYFLNRDWKPGGSGFQMFYGVAGQSQDILSNISSGRTGVYGIAQGAKYDYGVKGEAKTATNGYQVGGVFQTLSPVNNSSFSAGVYAKSPAALNSWAFYGNGSVLFNGGMLLPSDEAIKHEITPITNAMSVINQLNPVSFKYDTAFANTKGLNLAGEKNYGFTANEIQEILPELVYDVKKPDDLDTTGAVVSPEYAYKAMNYIPLIGILTAGIQEQQLSIDSLRNTSGSAAASNGLSVSSGNTVLGNNLGLTSAQLTNDREIPLNNKRLFFSDAGATSGLNNGIKIGGAGIGILEAKLDVTNASFGNGLNILTTTTSAGATNHGIITNCSGSSISNYAIEGTANDAASPANIGVRGNARNASGAGALNYGGDFEAFGNASGSSTNIGVSALATPANGVSNTGSNYGGRFKAQQGSIENYGMYAEAQYGSGNNYGVYATAVGGASNYAGYFNGDVTRTGSDNFTSDAMFKTNLDSISDALSIINSLKPRKFNYDTANTYGINFSSKKQYGFVAQDVQTVLPELIGSATHPATRDSAGNVISPAVTYKTLNYQAFSAIAIKAIQELKKENSHKDSALTSMQNQIDQLATLINSCCSNNVRTTSNTEVTYTDVELSDKDAITLSQNAPNPFAEHTLIQYNIPQDRGFAQIIFSDLKGQIIKVIDIKTKGKGQLNVFASDLSSGMYTYSLYVDGKLFETKKMLKTQ